MTTAAELGIESVQDIVINIFKIDGTVRGDELDFLCPNPSHLDRKPSCGINLETGLWFCFSCGIAGDLPRLGEIVLKTSRDEILERIKPHSTEGVLSTVQRKLAALMHRESPARLRLPGPYEDGPLDELVYRGFSPITLEKWGVRYVEKETLAGKSGEFHIEKSIAIPIRDSASHLMAWCYRRTDSSPAWQPRYLYTPGISLSTLWFGLQHHHRSSEVVIVEGALDAMWLDQATVPALGLLGATNISERKVLYLQRYKRVVLLGDRDHAGALAVQKLGSILGPRVPVFIAKYPKWVKASDPQELHPTDLEVMLTQAVPWAYWKNSPRKLPRRRAKKSMM